MEERENRTVDHSIESGVRQKVLVWCECGETPEGAVERHCLAFPEHRDSERFEIVIAGWCDQDVWVR